MKKILWYSLFLSMLCSTNLFAAFKDAGWGARPLGMGGAFTAVANDANAALFNPAGLAQSTQPEISFMSARLFTGLEGVDLGMNYLSYVQPLRQEKDSLAVTWASLSSAGLYREDTACISYGRAMGSENSAFGLSLKALRQEYDLDIRSANDPVFSDGSIKNGFTADVGFLTRLPDAGLTFALASKNITSPDMGLKTAELLPTENVLGIAYYQDQLPVLGLPYFTAALDIVNRDRQTDYRFGVETWLLDGAFAIRAGAHAQEVTCGLGYEIKIGKETKLIMDYAFALPLEIEETSGSHRMALTLRLP
jgi:hypothetical protein